MERYRPSFKKSSSLRVLAGAFMLALSPLVSRAQTYTTSQNFETANGGGNLGFVPTGGAPFTGNSSQFGSNASPAGDNLYVSGTRSYGVQNNANSGLATTVLDFGNVKLTNAATLTFRLATIATSNNTGLDATGSILVSINTDGGTTTGYTDVLRIVGTGNNGSGVYWGFAPNTNNTFTPATATYPVLSNYTAGTTSTTHYTQIRVTLPATLAQAKARITLNASGKTVLLVDDVQIGSSSPLPVELTRFAATAQAQSVGVSWTTTSEKNNDYFEVQRSTNAETFSAIGKIKGEGTSSNTTTYAFTDRAPVAGRSYYRLRQVDLDGTESFSPVASVNWSNKLEASFYPNPSHATVTLTGATGPLQYQIYSLAGQHLTSGEAQGGSTVDLSRLPAGVYLLELRGAGKRSVQRIVRQ